METFEGYRAPGHQTAEYTALLERRQRRLRGEVAAVLDVWGAQVAKQTSGAVRMAGMAIVAIVAIAVGFDQYNRTPMLASPTLWLGATIVGAWLAAAVARLSVRRHRGALLRIAERGELRAWVDQYRAMLVPSDYGWYACGLVVMLPLTMHGGLATTWLWSAPREFDSWIVLSVHATIPAHLACAWAARKWAKDVAGNQSTSGFWMLFNKALFGALFGSPFGLMLLIGSVEKGGVLIAAIPVTIVVAVSGFFVLPLVLFVVKQRAASDRKRVAALQTIE